jgi:hypothetical protein
MTVAVSVTGSCACTVEEETVKVVIVGTVAADKRAANVQHRARTDRKTNLC